MKLISMLLIQLLASSLYAMECNVTSEAEGCTIFTRCRKAADIYADCGSGYSGLMKSSSIHAEAVYLTVYGGSDSRVVDGKWVPGIQRDRKAFPLKIDELPRHIKVEDFYRDPQKIESYLKDTYNLNVRLEGTNFRLEVAEDTPLYKDGMAREPVRRNTASTASEQPLEDKLVCKWLESPSVQMARCGSKPGRCSGPVECHYTLRRIAPFEATAFCNATMNGCPDATACANEEEDNGDTTSSSRNSRGAI